jgi:hypothetical protein
VAAEAVVVGIVAAGAVAAGGVTGISEDNPKEI